MLSSPGKKDTIFSMAFQRDHNLLLGTRKKFSPFVEKIPVMGKTVKDVPSSLNSLAQPAIRAQENRKIREATGTMSQSGVYRGL